MPWLCQKSHVTDKPMNTRIQKAALFAGFTAIAIMLATSASHAGQKVTKKPTKNTGDQFQLTLSTVPYSKDPNSAFVRNHCEPGQKKKKPNS